MAHLRVYCGIPSVCACVCVCVCARAHACMHIYGYVCALVCFSAWCDVDTYFCMDIRVCGLRFQECHRLLSIWWVLCFPSPHLSQGGSGACNSEWGGRLPAGPSEESCLGWCVVTGSLAYESPAKLTQVSFVKNVISYCTLFHFSKLTRPVFFCLFL